ncbi:RNA polymerase sigma factor [Amycolatopsis sp. VC5-11]|uniref:RNA polymerase sigma factor n=1 Tax=Amycolatopsis sp. VC5-11 TaxID=3120156 RepID=UPI00300BF083
MSTGDATGTDLLPRARTRVAHAVAADAGDCFGLPEFASFAEYYRADARSLVRFLMMLGTSAHDAADIAHNVLADMFPKWEQIRSPRGWARQHATWALYRKPVSAQHETLVDVVPDSTAAALLAPEDCAEVAEAARDVRELLAPLPEQQRVVMAYVMEGFTHLEIAKLIRTTPSAVAKAAARARTSLKARVLADRQREDER